MIALCVVFLLVHRVAMTYHSISKFSQRIHFKLANTSKFDMYGLELSST
jgi:hypothetical protein